MSCYFTLRTINTNDIGNYFPSRWLTGDNILYANFTREKNGVGFFEIITSACTKEPYDIFWVVNEDNGSIALDFIVEVWLRPDAFGYRTTVPILFGTYLWRYSRVEELNDRRTRYTFMGVEINDLLSRVLVPPEGPQPPLVATTDPDPIWPWAMPAAEFFTGDGVSPSDTVRAMEQIVNHVAAITPEPFQMFTIPAVNPTGQGGIPDHPFSLRYDNMLRVLQDMSGTTWYDWYNNITLTTTPVDFNIDWNPDSYTATLNFYPGGLGTDRSVGNSGGVPSVILTPLYDNVTQPVSIADRRNEVTEIIIAGQGNDVSREIIRQRDPVRSMQSQYNVRQHFNTRKTPVFPGGIQDIRQDANLLLRDLGYRNDTTTIPKFNSNTVPILDYQLGDIVTVLYGGVRINKQVTKMDLKIFNHASGKSGGARGAHMQLELGLSSLDGSEFEGKKTWRDVLDLIWERQNKLEEDANQSSE